MKKKKIGVKKKKGFAHNSFCVSFLFFSFLPSSFLSPLWLLSFFPLRKKKTPSLNFLFLKINGGKAIFLNWKSAKHKKTQTKKTKAIAFWTNLFYLKDFCPLCSFSSLFLKIYFFRKRGKDSFSHQKTPIKEIL